MKKVIYLLAGLFLSTTAMHAQDRPMPKPGPSPTVNVGKPEAFTLKNGLKVIVVENHKLPRVTFNLSLDNAPYTEGDKKGVADMVSALMGSGTKKMSKNAFNEEVDYLGADIRFWDSGAAASGLSKYSGRILELMADGALNPVFTQEEFDKQKAQILEGLKSEEKDVKSVARRVTDVLTYGKNHPGGEFVSEATLNNVTLADVVQNYDTYFVPGKAYLVIVGDVKLKDVKKQVTKLFGAWEPGTAPTVAYSDPQDVQYTQVNFIDMPNAVQSEISVINVVNLKMTDKEYFATLLANQILGGGGEGRLFLNLREAHGWTYGAYSSIAGNKHVGAFTSSTSVRNAVTDSSVVEILNELKKMRADLVSAEDLKNAKAKYVGNFVMQIEKPATVARYALLTQTQSLPEDFYENYIKNINAVTPEDVKAAANKFFLADKSRIVIVGKAADVLPGLEKSKIPVNYFDKFGKPTEKPTVNKPVPAGVTAKTVLDGYIKAVGGEKALKAVKTIYTKSTGTVQGTPLELTTKVSVENKQLVEMKAMGMSMMKQVVNEKGGYMVQQGQKVELEGEDLAEMKASAVPFEELTLASKKDVKLSGIESINGTDAYAVKNGTTTFYYDVKTGYKIAEAHEAEGPDGKKATQTTYYSDYKDVKGIKVPHKVSMNVGIELDLTVVEAKINEGVTPADFQ
ncbi:M16 family metallopeptidase [Flavobacterium subsaxonicum]|uniref:Peptidase M16 n=1 Tax=Flavobacterium subsaxonicum WB 4.1-42 = DSM 21790 TaxID=1121898 RepID=A0A0A2MN08_9FLAO|nr:pitrilysin family protein [Flavobacterium subsaxonicum]KGO94062.1 peptidase M16 [Flavobacterium subsaxonicum WB 4.1-42 = DSM 21790]